MGRPNKRNQHQYQHQTHKPRGTPEQKLGRGLASSQDRSGSVQKAVTRRSMWSGAVHYSGTAYRSVRNVICGATHYTLHVLGMPFRLIIKPVTWTITSFKRAGDIENQLEGNYDACTQDLTRSQKEKTLQHEVDRLRKALSNEKEKFQKELQAIEKNHAAEIESRCRENRRIEDEYDDLQRNYQEVVTNSRNFQRVETDYQELERDYQRRESDYRGLQDRHRRETDGLQRRYDDMRRKLEAERKANEELSNRLSKALSNKLTDNNPNIADLSDENRPTKLAEKLSELYDNEWTNAYSVLEERYQEFEAISILLNILQDCCSQCRQQARDQLEAAKYKFKNCSSADQKNFKDERKRNVHMALPFVTQLLKISIENKLRPQFAPDLLINSDIQEYIQRCAELCWLMAVQDPPMAITKDVPRTLIHTKSYFKEYTKYGKYVDYVVWPAILIQDGGALMAKGIVQCCDRFEDSKLRD